MNDDFLNDIQNKEENRAKAIKNDPLLTKMYDMLEDIATMPEKYRLRIPKEE